MILEQIKDKLLSLLRKSGNLHEEKVFVTPKTGNQKPYWKTVEKGDKEEPKERPHKQEDEKNPRHAKQEDSNSSSSKPDIEAVKNATKEYCKQFKNNEHLYAELKQLGITWNETTKTGKPLTEGIRLCRAKMALNAAFANKTHGLSIDNIPKPTVDPANIKAPPPSEPDHIKPMIKLFYNSFSSPEEYFSKLKELGVTWKLSNELKINLMRANMALSTAIKNGLDLGDLVQQAQSTLPPPVKQSKDIVPGPHMVEMTSKEAVQQFYSQFKTRTDFYNALKDLGVEWKESPVERINIMRAKMAASHRVDEGLDLNTAQYGDSKKKPSQLTAEQKSGEVPKPEPVKEESKALVKKLHTACPNDEVFLENLRQIGVDWKENDHKGINLMRAKMAASQMVNNGFDLESEFKKLGVQIPKLPTESSSQTSTQPTESTEQRTSSQTEEKPSPQATAESKQFSAVEPKQQTSSQTVTQPTETSNQQSEQSALHTEQPDIGKLETKVAQAEVKAAQAEVKAAKTELESAKKQQQQVEKTPPPKQVDQQDMKQQLLVQAKPKQPEQFSSTTESGTKQPEQKKQTAESEKTEQKVEQLDKQKIKSKQTSQKELTKKQSEEKVAENKSDTKNQQSPSQKTEKQSNKLQDGLGEHYNTIQKLVNKIPKVYSSLKGLWSHFEKSMEIVSNSKGYFYSPSTGKINFEDGSAVMNPDHKLNNLGHGRAVFHEGAHYIDYAMSDIANDPTAVSYSCSYNDGEFVKALQKDIKTFLKKHGLGVSTKSQKRQLRKDIAEHYDNGDVQWFIQNGLTSKKSRTLKTFQINICKENGIDIAQKDSKLNRTILFDKLVGKALKHQQSKQLAGLKDMMKLDTDEGKQKWALFSDILSGATNGDIVVEPGKGHSPAYWKNTNISIPPYNGLAAEAFAEFTESIMSTNATSIETIKEHLPNAHKVYKKMLKDLHNIHVKE